MTNNQTVAIISHDAGGAEILCNWLVRQSHPYVLAVDGPAKNIFEKKIGSFDNLSVEEAVQKSDWVLTGTSWQSNVEIDAIEIARKQKKKSASFLDHWVHYRQRFEKGDDLILPDEIWVGDKDAQRIACETFPDSQIRLEPNPYFEDVRKQVQERSQNTTNENNPSILFLCAPLREHAKMKFGDERYWGFTEEDAVEYFLKNIEAVNHPTNNVVLRPHPSEGTGKYDWAIEKFGSNISIGGKVDLLDDIAKADTIVGYNSMAMVIGLIAGKRIINAIPPGRIVNTLPMVEIEQFNDLLKNK